MQVTDIIYDKIARLPKGYTFTYSTFDSINGNKEAIIKCLNRMVSAGKLYKLSKGKFYKPENSVFGELPLSAEQLVKDLLEKNGKTIGYITGYSAYNELGLTTQLPNIIQIGRNEIRSDTTRSIYKISFIKQKNIITKSNINLLKILDSIRFIKVIPDASIDDSCERLSVIISKLSLQDMKLIVKLAMNYPPATRALLGALSENTFSDLLITQLRKSLNPITTYKLPVTASILPNAKQWNIK